MLGSPRHHGVSHIAKEPAHVPEGLAHPLRAVARHADRREARGQHHPHVGVSLKAFEHPPEQATAAGALGEGAHRAAEGCLVGGQYGLFRHGHREGRQRLVEIGERRAAGKDAVGRLGDNGISIGRESAGRFHADDAALKEGEERVELPLFGKAILLLRLTDAGERQGVVALRADPFAAAAGCHGHGEGRVPGLARVRLTFRPFSPP